MPASLHSFTAYLPGYSMLGWLKSTGGVTDGDISLQYIQKVNEIGECKRDRYIMRFQIGAK